MKAEKPEIISTQRLSLHAMADHDGDDLISLLTHPEVTKTFMVPDFKSREEAMGLFERLKQLSRSAERFVYGIYLEGRLMGLINEVEVSETGMELGYAIHPDCKNKGFATEALAAAMEVLFDAGYSAVTAGAFEENAPSIRVMEKCGMVRLAQTEELEYRGRVHRCVLFEKRNPSAG